MKQITIAFFTLFCVILSTKVNAQTNLLNNVSEDGSFSTYTINQTDFWTPTLKPGTGYWETDGANGSRTSIRVHNTLTNPNYKSPFHYLQVCMDENNNGANYVWRKLSGLKSGARYLLTFCKSMKSTVADKSVLVGIVANQSDIQLAVNAGEPNTLSNSLIKQDTLKFITETVYTKESYSFTVPQGKTEVLLVWLRNKKVSNTGTNVACRMFIDDISLYKLERVALDSSGVHPSILFNSQRLNLIKQAISIKKEPFYSTFAQYLKPYCDGYLSYTPQPYTGAVTDDFYSRTLLPASIARNMAVMYNMTGNIVYAQKSAQVINAFAAAMTGSACIDNGYALKIARATFPFVCAYDMLLTSGIFTQAQKNQITQYFRMIETKVKLGIQDWDENDYFNKQYYNNHLVSHAMSLLAIGIALDDASLIQYIVDSDECPRDVLELHRGLILMPDDADCARVTNLPKEAGEIMDRYRHITYGGRGLQYSTLTLHLFAPIAMMCKNHGWDLFQYKAPTGEELLLSFNYYSDYWRTKDSGIKWGYYGPHAQEDARLNSPNDWIGVFDLALGQFPDSQPLKDVVASYNRTGHHMELLGFTAMYAPLNMDSLNISMVKSAIDINNNGKSRISYFKNALTVTSDDLSTFRIINTSGRVVVPAGENLSTQFVTNISLMPGLYFVQVFANQNVTTHKLLITSE